MTRDDILRMAQQAGFNAGWANLWISNFEQFAEMAAAKVRQERAQEIEELRGKANYAEKWRGLATAKNGDGRIVAEIEQEKRDAVMAEREACADLIERTERYSSSPKAIYIISHQARIEQADAIRKRGEAA